MSIRYPCSYFKDGNPEPVFQHPVVDGDCIEDTPPEKLLDQAYGNVELARILRVNIPDWDYLILYRNGEEFSRRRKS